MERSGPLKERIEGFMPGVVTEMVEQGIYGNLNERYMDLPPDSAFKKDLDRLRETAEDWHKRRDGSGSCHNCGFR
jgi:hypothetical protein